MDVTHSHGVIKPVTSHHTLNVISETGESPLPYDLICPSAIPLAPPHHDRFLDNIWPHHLYKQLLPVQRTITLDSEIIISVDENRDVSTNSAILHHFTPTGAPPPIDGALHFVFSKIASIDSSANVGDGFSPLANMTSSLMPML